MSCNTDAQRNGELAIKLELIIRACFYLVEYLQFRKVKGEKSRICGFVHRILQEW